MNLLLGYIGPGAGFAAMGYFLTLCLALCLAGILLMIMPVRIIWRKLAQVFTGIRHKERRMVIIGLDGLDPCRARELMRRGELPWMRKLADQGFFGELKTTMPPISPVAWSSFLTGVNPGKHNIFDFIMPDRKDYRPLPAHVRVRANLRNKRASMYSLRKSRPFWRILGESGIFSAVLRVPITFPPEPFAGHCLAGMGVPDLRGTQSSFTFYTTGDMRSIPASGGITIAVEVTGNRIKTYLPGPAVPDGGEALRIPVEIGFEGEVEDGAGAWMKIGGKKTRLCVGVYTPWIKLSFRTGWRKKIHGICKFLLISGPPDFKLYATPLQIDPEYPDMPVSSPGYYSVYLAKRHGEFATLGLAEDTSALSAGILDEKAFLTQAYSIHDERERIFFDTLDRIRSGLCIAVFDLPDRVQHMFSPPAADSGNANNAVCETYRRLDSLIGRTLGKIDDSKTALLVISDHGFGQFKRGININVWLRDMGLLALLSDASTKRDDNGFDGVDWTKTRAYAMGLCGIYLNLRGRESQGIVSPGAEAADLKELLTAELRKLTDAHTGQKAISNVYDSGVLYSGPYLDNAPDLLVGYAPGYRIAWESVLGYAETEVFIDNPKKWSGDHAMDAEAVPGVFMSNRPIKQMNRAFHILDIAPTVLSYFGVEPPGYMDGEKIQPRMDANEHE